MLLVNFEIEVIRQKISNFPFFTGKYTDFIPGWYSDVGATIMFTVIMNTFVPHISVFIIQLVRMCSRCLDSGWDCDGNGTKLSGKEYIDLYAGPQFPIHTRYSEVSYDLILAAN